MFETIAGYAVWTILALAYVAMLALTERSAAHFVANDMPHETPDIVVITAGRPHEAASRAPRTAPASVPRPSV